MAGLVPAIHVRQHAIMQGGWVYILASAPNGILYVGVTSDIIRRIYQHRNGLVPGFTKRYGVKLLVYFERYDDIQTAIQREHNIKHWSRTWKVRLILRDNPEWKDLYDTIVL
ncbi:MAG: GIY-YIG nuclease family protein [Bradyrhizobiaceae bacterium]|jgi:putative endonuclease|nr:MAG: GIY-YIG nuclease family protein [Bradyrhizobiaceae bacterium]